MSAQNTIRLLQALNAPVQQAGQQYLQQATQNPNRRVLNPGQDPSDLLTNPTNAQNRGLLAASLQMMAHNPAQMPGATLQKAAQAGFGEMDKARAAQQQAGTAGAKGRYELAKDNRDYLTKGLGVGAKAPSWSYGSTSRYRDSKGNEYMAVMGRNDQGQVQTKYTPITPDAPPKPQGELTPLGSKGLSGEERVNERAQAGFLTAQRENAAQNAQQAFEDFRRVRDSMGIYQEALTALDQGANTGAVAQYFPSVTGASIALENARNRLGLNIIGATTFGSLSEQELKFALDTAIPENMSEPDLKKWLARKMKAQQALMTELEQAAKAFTNGMTQGEYIDMLKEQGKYEGPEQSKDTESLLKRADEILGTN